MAVDERIVLALGRVVISFQGMETALSLLIWDLLGIDNQTVGHIATGGRNMQSLLDLFENLYPMRVQDPARLEGCERLLKLARSITDRRNIYMHSTYSTNDKTGELYRWRIRKDGITDDVVVVAEDIEAVTQDAREAVKLAMVLLGPSYRTPDFAEPPTS